MSFLNSFRAGRAFKRVFIKNRNHVLDRMRSVKTMMAVAQSEISCTYASFHSNIENYVACLYVANIVNLKGDEFDDELNDYSNSRHAKFNDNICILQDRLKAVFASTSDDISKKKELRKIINKSIRMRKFYSY